MLSSTHQKSARVLVVERRWRRFGIPTQTTVRIGGTYLVSPLNPQKLKHRGRRARVLAFVPNEKSGFIEYLRVEFLDDERPAQDLIDPTDIIVQPETTSGR